MPRPRLQWSAARGGRGVERSGREGGEGSWEGEGEKLTVVTRKKGDSKRESQQEPAAGARDDLRWTHCKGETQQGSMWSNTCVTMTPSPASQAATLYDMYTLLPERMSGNTLP